MGSVKIPTLVCKANWYGGIIIIDSKSSQGWRCSNAWPKLIPRVLLLREVTHLLPATKYLDGVFSWRDDDPDLRFSMSWIMENVH